MSTRALEPATAPELAAGRLGMWIFLASELLFFGVVFVVYGALRMHAPAGFATAAARTDLGLGTLNTALLLTSSLAIALAAEGPPASARPALGAAIALGFAFLLIKGVEYRHEWTAGLFPGAGFTLSRVPGAELFFAWYLLATALHAVHLLIGIGLCTALALDADLRCRWLAGVALYWHFVDLVWIFLYPLIYLVGLRP